MPQVLSQYGMLIILIVFMVAMMWFQSRNAKKRQNEMRSFHDSLEAGTEVITIGGIIGKVVSVDAKYEEIVIDSEGSLLRVSFRAVNRTYIRPAFISDEEAESAEKASESKSGTDAKEVEDSSKTVESSASAEDK